MRAPTGVTCSSRSVVWERRFERPMIVAALLTVPILTAEPDSQAWSTVGWLLDWGVVGVCGGTQRHAGDRPGSAPLAHVVLPHWADRRTLAPNGIRVDPDLRPYFREPAALRMKPRVDT